MAKRAKTRTARSGRAGKKATKKAAKKKAGTRRPAGKTRGRKTPGRKAAARKAATRKTSARKTSARKTSARKPAPRRPARKQAKAVGKVRQAKPARPSKPVKRPTPHRDAAAQAAARKQPSLDRERRRLAETDEELMPSAPSSLGYEGGSSAARSGRSELRDSLAQHTETGPALTGGDVDASWEDAYAVGDEAPGGDNPTPDQDIVDEIGKALGVQYDDNEELKGAEKIQERDRHRWELDPASSDDYRERAKDED
jgi:hypothetical protein